MDLELKASRISIILHLVTGIIAGYLSFVLGRTLYAVGIAILILIISGFAAQKIVKQKGIKWWLGNGAILYLFFWLISWIAFYNLLG